MTQIIDRRNRVTVQPVQPRRVTLDQGVVMRVQEAQRVIAEQKPTNASVTPTNPRIVVGVGRPGMDGDKNYVHIQAIPSTTWTVVHNLNKRAAAVVVDSSDRVVEGDVEYNSDNQMTLTFSAAFSGKAYIN